MVTPTNAVLDDPELQAGLSAINPKFGDFCTRVAGEAWGLPLIDQKTKALITIAVDVVIQDQVGPGSLPSLTAYAYADRLIGDLLDSLARAGLRDKAAIFIAQVQ